jgi:hypothetical protein
MGKGERASVANSGQIGRQNELGAQNRTLLVGLADIGETVDCYSARESRAGRDGTTMGHGLSEPGYSVWGASGCLG